MSVVPQNSIKYSPLDLSEKGNKTSKEIRDEWSSMQNQYGLKECRIELVSDEHRRS